MTQRMNDRWLSLVAILLGTLLFGPMVNHS